MANLQNIPLEDNFETTLAQSFDGTTTGTMYVNAIPTATIPASEKVYVTINPGKSYQQCVRVSAWTTGQMTVDSVTVEKGNGVNYTGVTHNVGSKVVISNNYVVFDSVNDAIDSKLDNDQDMAWNAATTFAGVKAKGLTTTQRDALVSPANGSIIYNTTTGEFNIYQGGARSVMSSGSTQPNGSETVAGKFEEATQTETDQGGSTGGTGADIVPTPQKVGRSIQKQAYTYATDTGTANAYVVTLAPVPTAYVEGMRIIVKVTNSNTGASTINVNSLGAKNIKDFNNEDIVSNTLISGKFYELVYDGTSFIVTRDYVWYFGHGDDGNVTISGNTTLTRDMYYNNLTVNNGVTLSTGGYKIFVAGTLTNNGTISRAPNNGSTPSPYNTGAAGGAALSAGSLGVNNAGTNGANGPANNNAGIAGTAGSAITYTLVTRTGKTGGKGGNTGAGGSAGGNGGTAYTLQNGILYNKKPNKWYDMIIMGERVITLYNSNAGGTGGGSGSSQGASSSAGAGGGGGSSGGIIFISAAVFSNAGTISAIGGNGGNGGSNPSVGFSTAAGGGGGGGGGDGGSIILVVGSYTNSGTITVAGGSGGNGGNGINGGGGSTAAGGNGGDGGDGGIVYINKSVTQGTITVSGGSAGTKGTDAGITSSNGTAGSSGSVIIAS